MVKPKSSRVQCSFLTEINVFLVEWVKTDLVRLWIENTHQKSNRSRSSQEISSKNKNKLCNVYLFWSLLFLSVKVGNLFGSRRSTIITLYNGAFDSSSALFLVIKVRFHPVIYVLKTWVPGSSTGQNMSADEQKHVWNLTPFKLGYLFIYLFRQISTSVGSPHSCLL